MLVEIISKKNFFVSFLTFVIASVIAYYISVNQPVIIRLSTIALAWIILIMAQQQAPAFGSGLGAENLPAIFLAFMLTPTMANIKQLFIALITLIGFILILNVYKSKREASYSQIFNISLLFATAAVLNPPYVIMILFLFYVFHQRVRNLLIIIISYIFVVYIYFVVEIFFLKTGFIQAWHKLASWDFVGLGIFSSYQWIFYFVLFSITFLYVLTRISNETIKNRKILWTTIILWILSIGVNLFSTSNPLAIVVFPLSLLLSYFFYTLKLKSWIKDLLFLIIIVLNFAFGFQLI